MCFYTALPVSRSSPPPRVRTIQYYNAMHATQNRRLKKDWKKEYGITHVLTVIKCLLIHPNPASALNEEAGKLLLEQYEEFAKHAKMMTEVHARPKGADAAAAAAADGSAESASKRPTDGSNPVAKKMKEKAAGKKKTDKKKKALKRL